MFFKNSIGTVYILDDKKLILRTSNRNYSFESNNPFILQEKFYDYIDTLTELEIENMYFVRLHEFMNEDF